MYFDTFPGKRPQCAGPVPRLPCPPWWILLDYSLWGFFYKADYIPWIPTAAYQLQQCNTEVGNKWPRYAMTNIWSIRLWMVHLQNNQGTAIENLQTIYSFLIMRKWFLVTAIFHIFTIFHYRCKVLLYFMLYVMLAQCQFHYLFNYAFNVSDYMQPYKRMTSE
jgi:hypothetical protein